MNRMTAETIMITVSVLLTLAASNGIAQTVPADWKTDCVGRMQISLPGKVDIGAMLPKEFIKDVSGKGSSFNKFADGQGASWSNFGFDGRLDITHPSTVEERADINASFRDAWLFANSYSETQGDPPLIELLNDSEKGRAWHGENFYIANLHVGQVSLRWGTSTGLGDMPNVAKNYQILITGLRPRLPFDLPKEPGVCLPYLFIRDEGYNHRHVGMTYRLKAHPDITVWLEDGTAAIIDTHQDPTKFTANAKAAFFWEQRYQNRLTFQSLWPEHRAFKPTTFAGQPGTKTFVELTRNDDKRTKDYGYLIAVRGDPNAEKDTPDLMLYVIQDSANAVSRGIKPLSKAAFFKMAETIAASVKRRETSLR